MNTGNLFAGRRLAAAAMAVSMALMTPVLVAAQQAAPEAAGAPRTVALFDSFCYSNVPDLAAVERAAEAGKWQPITGAALQGFRPAAAPQLLKAWNFKDLGVAFRLAISRSAMDAQGARDMPAFADATVYACSLVLPGASASKEIAAAMDKLMERKRDETYEQGPLTVSAWSGATEKLGVIIHHYHPKSGAPGGLLAVTLMQKP